MGWKISICWTIHKSHALHSRQITMSAPYHSFFAGWCSSNCISSISICYWIRRSWPNIHYLIGRHSPAIIMKAVNIASKISHNSVKQWRHPTRAKCSTSLCKVVKTSGGIVVKTGQCWLKHGLQHLYTSRTVTIQVCVGLGARQLHCSPRFCQNYGSWRFWQAQQIDFAALSICLDGFSAHQRLHI